MSVSCHCAVMPKRRGSCRQQTATDSLDVRRSRGFGFVTMAAADAQTAIDSMNGQDFMGRSVRVNEATPQGERGGGRGGYRGGGGGGYDNFGGGRGECPAADQTSPDGDQLAGEAIFIDSIAFDKDALSPQYGMASHAVSCVHDDPSDNLG